MTVGELQREGASRLPRGEGLPDPGHEARWLLARAMERSESWVLAHGDEPVEEATTARFRAWVERRAGGEPAHYIAGACSFCGREFLVSPAALIPRPETELVISCVQRLTLPPRPHVLDVGTGSGCLAVTLALDLPDASVAATDLSLAALELGRRNGERLSARVHFAMGDLASHLRAPFDLIVANLPYVPSGEVAGLPREIRDHEPPLALAGGADGADLLRDLLADLPRLLAPRGFALLEMGPGQRHALAPLLAALGLSEVERGLDHAGVERVLVLQRVQRPVASVGSPG